MDNWWTSFFAGNWLDVQRAAFSDEKTQAESALIRTWLALEPGMKALDVPCGTGRISVPLAEAGIAVTGVEQSEDILEDARRAAAERGVGIDLCQGDMRDLPWESEFDAALCWWGSFGYLDDEGNAEFMRAVAKTLKPGGRFLIDTHVAETLYPKFQARGWNEVSGSLIVEERRLDMERGRIDGTWRIFNGGEWDIRSSSIRVYTYRELRELFLSSGFESVEGFAGHTLQPFAFGASRLVVVGTKG
jgi:SAM-dependent methyltransferase